MQPSTSPSARRIRQHLLALALATIAALPALGCSTGADEDVDSATSAYGSRGTWGNMDTWPDADYTRVVGDIRYGQRVDGIPCIQPSDRHPPDERYMPTVQYCALAFQGTALDKISVSLTNVDNWGTDEIRGYILDDHYRIIDQGRFVAANHNGYNSEKAVTFRMKAGRQLRKTGRYYVAFVKFAMRDGAHLKTYKAADGFSVQLDAVTSDQLPIAVDHAPVRSGIYTSPRGDYLVDVVPPALGSAKDLDAWHARIYTRKDGCKGGTRLVDDLDQVDCDGSACWFLRARSAELIAASLPGSSLKQTGALTHYHGWPLPYGNVAYASVDVDLSFVREASDLERDAYTGVDGGCVVTCPPPPPSSGPYSNPCGGSGAPGWCRAGWQAPFGFQSPLVFNLDAGETIQFLNKGVPFDLDGHGSHPLDWVSPKHPFLVLDRNHNGIVDDGTELFGTATPLGTGQTAPDGFAALAQYDTNGDMRIDEKDAIFNRLQLWFDKNSNGVTDPGELRLLMFSGIDAINLTTKAQPSRPLTGSQAFVTLTSTFEQRVCSSTTMFVADVWFPSSR
jgi:hypothetical protein